MPSRDSRGVALLLDYAPSLHRNMDYFLLRLLDGLRARGRAPALVVSGEPSGEFLAAAGDPPSLVLPHPFASLTSGDTQAILAFLRPLRPEVIYTAFISPFCPLLPRLRLALRARIQVHDHSSGGVSAKRGLARLAARLRGLAVGALLDEVAAVSEFVARRDIDQVHLPAAKVRAVLNGVDLSRYQPLPSRPSGPPVVAYAGQLIEEKGLRTLLDAFASLPPEAVRGAELHLAGRGPLEAELRRVVDQRGLERVRLLGHVDSVPELFARAELVVVPSEWDEAFGLVAAEALACGTPVLGSDAGGVPEVIGPDGECGRIFPRGDAAALARALHAMLADPDTLDRMRPRARERAERCFDIERMVGGILDYYDRLA